MSLSLICVKQIIIMFLLVGVGFMCGRTKIIDKQTNSKLSSFVLDIVNPVLIFMSYQQAFDIELLKGLGLSIGLGLCSYALIFAVLALLFRKNGTDEAVVAKFAAVYSNCGFMGIPLIRGLFGAEGVLYMTGYLTVFNIFVWTHGLTLFSKGKTALSVRKIITSPSIIAIILGIISYVTGFRLNEIPAGIKVFSLPLYSILSFVGELFSSAAQYIADCNTPLAMICAGVTISLTDIRQHIQNKNVYLAIGLRLLVCPLLFWVIFRFFAIPETVFMTVLIASGCPAAATGTMFALKFNNNAEMSAVIFASTTILSAMTLPLLVMLATV